MSEDQGRGRSQGTFTDAFSIFDNKNGMVRFGFVDNKAFVSISPVFPDMRGKRAEKGAKVYDYNNRMMFVLQIEAIPLICQQMEMIEAGQVVEAFHDAETKVLGIHGPNVWDNVDGYSVTITDKQSQAQNLVGLYFQETAIGLDANQVPVKVVTCPEWELVKQFFGMAGYLNVFQMATHGAKMAGATGGGGGGSSQSPTPVQQHQRSRRLGGGSVPSAGAPAASAPEPRAADEPGDFFDEEFRGEPADDV